MKAIAITTLLAATDLVRFAPDPDYNGTAGNLSFRAWDLTSGSNGDSLVDVSTHGNDTAFSTTADGGWGNPGFGTRDEDWLPNSLPGFLH